MQLAVSVTMLQKFNRYLCDVDNRVTQQDMVKDITQKSEETNAMRWGALFHSILEDPKPHLFTVDSGDGTVREFYGNEEMCIAPETLFACQHFVPVMGVRECKTVKSYIMDNGDEVFVTMKADHVSGETIYEHKSRWNKELSDYEIEKTRTKYESSIQAKFYADAFHCKEVRYNVFYMANGSPVTTCEHIETVTLGLFENVHHECRAFVQHFMEMATNNGIISHLHGRMSRVDLQPY